MEKVPLLELPVMEWARELARELPIYNGFLVVGLVLVSVIFVAGRTPVTQTLAWGYVASFVLYVPLRKRLRERT